MRTHSLSSESEGFTLKSGNLVKHRDVFCRQLCIRTGAGRQRACLCREPATAKHFYHAARFPSKQTKANWSHCDFKSPTPSQLRSRATLACQIGPICRHHSLSRIHLRKQRHLNCAYRPVFHCISLITTVFVFTGRTYNNSEASYTLSIILLSSRTQKAGCATLKPCLCQLLWNKTERTQLYNQHGSRFLQTSGFCSRLEGWSPPFITTFWCKFYNHNALTHLPWEKKSLY